ncbi:MAG: PHP domain-containing protein [Eubacterium sp.]|nr:PHP domain-containing protein [Eubacterium sp.]
MLANHEVDLHGHTTRSDGSDTPEEFILHAKERGVKVCAITDHDVIPPRTVTIDGVERDIQEWAREQGVEVMLGIEVSCETWIDDTHLVCFGCDWDDPFFKELDDFTIKSKVGSYKKLAERLTEKGMPVDWQEVLDNDGHPVPESMVQKKMLFELMARKGYFDSWSDAKLYVKEARDLAIKREKPDAVTVIKEAHRTGGYVIMAHPYLVTEPVTYKGKIIHRSVFIEHLIEAGLDGIEASYTYDKTSYFGKLSKKEIKDEVIQYYGDRLFISGGSDYHADGKKGVKNPREIGDCGISMEEFLANERLVAMLNR